MLFILGTLCVFFPYLASDAWQFTISRRQEVEFIERAIALEKRSGPSLKATHESLMAHRMYGIRSTYVLPWLFGLMAVLLAAALIGEMA